MRSGTLSEADVDRAVHAVLRVKFMLGLFDHPLVDPSLNQKVYRAPQHLAVSMDAALESMTLLKNDDHLLPLSKELRRITVIGPNGDVARYGDYERENNGEHISILEGVRDLLPRATVTFDDGKDIPAAVAAANGADVVVMGLGEREGIPSRKSGRDASWPASIGGRLVLRQGQRPSAQEAESSVPWRPAGGAVCRTASA